MRPAGFFHKSVFFHSLLLVVAGLQVFLFTWAFRLVARGFFQDDVQRRSILVATTLALASTGFELLLIPFILNLALSGLYATRGNLGALRSAVSLFHEDAKLFPKSLAELVPAYLSRLPPTHVLHHEDSAAVQLLSDEDYRIGRFTDAGGWAYVASGPQAGLVLINCTHRDPNGSSWTSQGAP